MKYIVRKKTGNIDFSRSGKSQEMSFLLHKIYKFNEKVVNNQGILFLVMGLYCKLLFIQEMQW